MQKKPHLGFVSPVFLFPNDAGGKIRTTNILRTLMGGAFEITLISVASAFQEQQWHHELASVCDKFIRWEPSPSKPIWRRAFDLLSRLPINVVADRSVAGLRAVEKLTSDVDLDVVVFDFVHSAVLLPPSLSCPSVCFTHNVEAEIFDRHAKQARDPPRRFIWSSQHRKMLRFERDALRRFDSVIAVSERDAEQFRTRYAIADARAIPTGVDLDFFTWSRPPIVDQESVPKIVFTGSMNWMPNIEGVKYFLQEVWPLVLRSIPNALFVVVGKSPPVALTQLASQVRGVQFTGFVDDVRPYVHAAHAFVIPLFVGGGTRIKAFEAMAMGCPLVSTSIGMEGLNAQADIHYLLRDEASSMANALITLLRNDQLRNQMSIDARRLVEGEFGHKVAGKVFEEICLSLVH